MNFWRKKIHHSTHRR